MSEPLNEAGYLQTKAKLEDLLRRRSQIAARDELDPSHCMEVLHSYDRMIGQYRKEIKLYEASHRPAPRAAGT